MRQMESLQWKDNVPFFIVLDIFPSYKNVTVPLCFWLLIWFAKVFFIAFNSYFYSCLWCHQDLFPGWYWVKRLSLCIMLYLSALNFIYLIITSSDMSEILELSSLSLFSLSWIILHYCHHTIFFTSWYLLGIQSVAQLPMGHCKPFIASLLLINY